MLTIKTLQCPRCHDLIYSRTEEDHRECTCGAIAISGGHKSTKVTWSSEIGSPDKAKWIMIEVNATIKKLEDDWNAGKDNYGILRSKENKEKIRKRAQSTRKTGLKPGDIFNPVGE